MGFIYFECLFQSGQCSVWREGWWREVSVFVRAQGSEPAGLGSISGSNVAFLWDLGEALGGELFQSLSFSMHLMGVSFAGFICICVNSGYASKSINPLPFLKKGLGRIWSRKANVHLLLDRAQLLLLQDTGLWSFQLGCSVSRDLCGCSWQTPVSFGSPSPNNGTHAFIPQLCWLSDGALGKELVRVVSRLFHSEESIWREGWPWAEGIHHSNLKAHCAQFYIGPVTSSSTRAVHGCPFCGAAHSVAGSYLVKPMKGVWKHPARHWLAAAWWLSCPLRWTSDATSSHRKEHLIQRADWAPSCIPV